MNNKPYTQTLDLNLLTYKTYTTKKIQIHTYSQNTYNYTYKIIFKKKQRQKNSH
jgi:hypothetical protein